ncbi:MAG: YqgE/AlgH family protein [Deferrisomatales bacterium]
MTHSGDTRAAGNRPPTGERTLLRGHFLVAMPQLKDPNFEQTVVLLCEHGEDGALGVVVNRPTPLLLGQIYEGQGIEGTGGEDEPIHYGGPVQPEMGFVLHEGGEYEGSLPVVGDLRLGTSLEILRDIAAHRGPRRFLFFLGYAGWAPDQMEQEIARNDWLVVPADPELLFAVPAEKRWEEAIRILGIDPSLLSQQFGTA